MILLKVSPENTLVAYCNYISSIKTDNEEISDEELVICANQVPQTQKEAKIIIDEDEAL